MTMYSSVSSRTAEIATLRALGFSQWRILSVFFLESLLIGLLGEILGLAGASLLQWQTISTMNFATFSELATGSPSPRPLPLRGSSLG